MSKEKEQLPIDFAQDKPRTLREMADHVNVEYKQLTKIVRRLVCIGKMKQADKVRINDKHFNTYIATSLRHRDALESSNEAVTTPAPSFMHDPMMAAFYSKQNI